MTDNPTPTNSTLRELAEAAPELKLEASNSDERYEREDRAGSWHTFGGRSRDGDFFISVTGFDDAKSKAEAWALYLAEAANPTRILALLDERDKLAGEVERLTENGTDKATAWDAVSEKNAEITSFRTQLSEAQAKIEDQAEDLKGMMAEGKRMRAEYSELSAVTDEIQAERDAAMREASSLAMSLYRQHYHESAPNFELLDSVAGIISQIDNMSAGLGRAKVRFKAERDAAYEGLKLIESGAPRKSEYPKTYKGGFDAGCDWAGSIARNYLRKAAQLIQSKEGS